MTTNKKIESDKKESKSEPKTYTVYTPVENYCGNVAGVQFAYGKANVNEGWILNWFKENGYRATPAGNAQRSDH